MTNGLKNGVRLNPREKSKGVEMGRAAISTAIGIYLATVAITAQPQAPRFEVASVRLIEPAFLPDRMSGGRVDLTRQLSKILQTAFRVQPHQLSGPDWLDQVWVEIHAAMPAGALNTQVPEMLHQLLVERFGLVTHREPRPTDVYELLSGPDGIKVREVEPADELKRVFVSDPSTTMFDTTAETAQGAVRTISIPGGARRITSRTMYERTRTPSGGLVINATRMNMAELAPILQENLDRPLIDKTGLTGVYQFKLELPFDPIGAVLDAGAAAFRATQGGSPGAEPVDRRPGVPAMVLEGLGLKLERRRVPIEVVVVDRISRTPTEN